MLVSKHWITIVESALALSTSLSPGNGGPVSRLPLLSVLANGLFGVFTVSMTGSDANLVILGFFGIDCRITASGPFDVGKAGVGGSPNGAAERERPIGGGVGRDPGGWCLLGMAAASSDCVDWWGMRETVDIVETLACVGDTRLCVRLGGADKGGGVDGCANPAGGN